MLTASSTLAGPMSVPVHLLSHSGDATPHAMVADSGSGHSFVTQAVVDSLGLQTHPLLKRVTWAGFVGGAVHYSNQGVTITVRYSPDITIQHTFIVAPTAPVPIILGRDEMSRGSECHMLIDPEPPHHVYSCFFWYVFYHVKTPQKPHSSHDHVP